MHADAPRGGAAGLSVTLLVSDDLALLTRALRDGTTAGRTLILPLGITADEVADQLETLGPRTDAEIYPVERVAAAARDHVAATYPALLHALIRERRPEGSLLDILREGDLSLWWLGESSEKSALRCRLVSSLYSVELVTRARAECGATSVVVALADEPLARTLATLPGSRRASAPRPARQRGFAVSLVGRRLRFFARAVATKLLLPRLASDVPRASHAMFFTNYPLNWANALSPDGADRVYGQLPAFLARHGPGGYVATISDRPLQIWRRRHAMRARMRERGIVSVFAGCSIGDLLSIISPAGIGRVTRAVGATRARGAWRYGDVDALPLLVDELECGLGSNELPYNLLVARAIPRITRAYRPRFLVHWGEWQPTEKAIWFGLRGTATKSVAVQHSMSSPMFVNYSFVPGELAPGNRDATAMPLPDLFVSNGEYATVTTIAAGFPPARARACGAIRYRGLMELAASPPPRETVRRELGIGDTERVILFATASKRRDNRSMMQATIAALRDASVPLRVLVKCHPFAPMEQEIARAFADTLPQIPVTTFGVDVPLHRLLLAADLMLVNSSASGVEAMALGVPAIYYHNPHIYDVSVLYSLPNAVLFACNATELRASLQSVMRDPAVGERLRAAGRGMLPYLFHRVDLGAEERFAAFLEEHEA